MTPEQRAHRYLQASMNAGYTSLPREHQEAYHDQMRAHERAYPRVREHALAGADKDFDQPLTPGEREHQRHLRTQENLQEADVQRIRKELRDTTTNSSSRGGRRAAPKRAGGRAGRAHAAAGAGAAASTASDALHAATSGGGSTTIYILGVALLLILVYLLTTKNGPAVLTGAVNSLIGAAGAFIRPIDPIHQLETALGATELHPSQEGRAAGAPLSEYAPSPGGTKAEKTEVGRISKQEDWSAPAWEAVIERESGWNPNAVNAESGAYGIGQFLGATKQEYAAAGATSPNPIKQIQAMAAYIKNRYGTPTKALAHEQQFGWY